MNQTTTTPETSKAVAFAHRQLRKVEGITARTNVRSCCRGCVTNEDLGFTAEQEEDDTQTLLWVANIQGSSAQSLIPENNRRYVGYDKESGRSEYADNWKFRSVYVNHNGVTQELFDDVIQPAYEAAGLQATWSGETHDCILLTVDALDFFADSFRKEAEAKVAAEASQAHRAAADELGVNHYRFTMEEITAMNAAVAALRK